MVSDMEGGPVRSGPAGSTGGRREAELPIAPDAKRALGPHERGDMEAPMSR